MFEILDIVKKKEERSQGVFVNGEHVGEFIHMDDEFGSRFHAVIDISAFPGGLVQGFGSNPQDAVFNAVIGNRKTAIDRLVALEKLQQQLLEDSVAV